MFESDLTPTETKVLLDIVTTMDAPKNHYVEIGVFMGGTFSRVLQKTKHIQCVGVDLFEDFVLDKKSNTHENETLKMADLDAALSKTTNRHKLHKSDSVDYFNNLPRNSIAGVIFIDGNHKFYGCMLDFVGAYRVLEKGYILFHNASNKAMCPDNHYVDEDGGPYAVVQAALKFPGVKYIGTFDRTAVLEINH